MKRSPTVRSRALAARVIDLDAAQFDALLQQQDRPMLLDLWAPWCTPCLAMAPTLQRLAEVAGERLAVARIDIDRYPDIARRVRARGVPCLLLFSGGVEVARRVGLLSRAELRRWLDAQGVAVPDLGVAGVVVDTSPLSAFHGDEDRRGLIARRVQRMAEAGQLLALRLPRWKPGAATLSAAMVRSARPEVFERVTGMPYALACAMELSGARRPSEVAALMAGLHAGADLRHAAPLFMAHWLRDAEPMWPAVLHDPGADALRLDWAQACVQAASGAQVDAGAWAALRAAAESLDSKEPAHTVRHHLGGMLARLSPPPTDDPAAWMRAVLGFGGYLKSALARHRIGWTREDLGVETLRLRWMEANAPDPDTLTEAELQGWRATYRAAHETIEARYEALSAAYYESQQQHLDPVEQRLQMHLLQALPA